MDAVHSVVPRERVVHHMLWFDDKGAYVCVHVDVDGARRVEKQKLVYVFETDTKFFASDARSHARIVHEKSCISTRRRELGRSHGCVEELLALGDSGAVVLLRRGNVYAVKSDSSTRWGECVVWLRHWGDVSYDLDNDCARDVRARVSPAV